MSVADGSDRKIRYAVVGLGHIAQVAVLPAFKHAENSRLAAIVSDDPEKLRQLSKRYKVEAYDYAGYEACLRGGEIDAVYIALPNHLHCEYAVRAAAAGVHVLCEKPMAVTEEECTQMIHAAHRANVRLMVAYRLHFEEANLEALALARAGELGKVRFFESAFSMQVKADDIRLRLETGGGTLYDIGVYCINAARNVFAAEPLEVQAVTANGGDQRFAEVEEITSAILRFSEGRLAVFTTSFGAADVSSYRIVGAEADLRVEPAYDYSTKLAHHMTRKGKTRKKVFAKRDQFAPELIYFSRCVLEQREPEPSGREGLADVRVVRALYVSARLRAPVTLAPFTKEERPSLEQEIHRPPVSKPELVHSESPSR